MRTNIQPPAYFVALLILGVAVHFLLPVRQIIPYPFNLSGILLVVFGAVSNVWTDNLMKQHRTTVKPYELPTTLLVTGPFRLSRHPMYVGMVAILLGSALLLGSVSPFLCPVVFIILMEALFIPQEERNLVAAFGQEYRRYRSEVRRWL